MINWSSSSNLRYLTSLWLHWNQRSGSVRNIFLSYIFSSSLFGCYFNRALSRATIAKEKFFARCGHVAKSSVPLLKHILIAARIGPGLRRAVSKHRAQRSYLWPRLLTEVKFYGWYRASPLEQTHRASTQSFWVADCYFIVNVLDLPFASPIPIYR